MTNSSSRTKSRSDLPQLPISGLVAVSSALVSLIVGVLFTVLAVLVLWLKVDFGDESLAALALGASFLFLGLVAGIGLIAGVICTFSQTTRFAVVTFSLIVNCVLFLLVAGLMVFTIVSS